MKGMFGGGIWISDMCNLIGVSLQGLGRYILLNSLRKLRLRSRAKRAGRLRRLWSSVKDAGLGFAGCAMKLCTIICITVQGVCWMNRSGIFKLILQINMGGLFYFI